MKDIQWVDILEFTEVNCSMIKFDVIQILFLMSLLKRYQDQKNRITFS